jgi:quinol monooxygenase YgiN
MSDPKVIVSGWVTVDPKKRDAVVESFKDMVLRARSAPGCLDFAMTADPVKPGRLNLFEFWRSEKDLKAWRRVAGHPKRIAPLLRVKVQKHVIQKSGKPF